jgi:hypothetical protein
MCPTVREPNGLADAQDITAGAVNRNRIHKHRRRRNAPESRPHQRQGPRRSGRQNRPCPFN